MSMILYVALLGICISLTCIGLYVAFNGPGMVLNGLANFLTIHLPEYVRKPIFDCLVCMASVWTIVWWVALFGLWLTWWLPFCILLVAGINVLVTPFVNWIIEDDEQQA